MSASLAREIQRFQHARMSPAAVRRALGLRPVTCEPVKEEPEPVDEPPRRFPPTIDSVVRAVAAEARLAVNELVPPKGKKPGANDRESTRARQMLFLMLRQRTSATLTQIAACCCCGTSTVGHGVQKIERLARRDPAIADLYRRVCERLENAQ